MRKFIVTGMLWALALSSFAQVDVEHRRVLALQSGIAVAQSEEAVGGFGYFWFNENNYPWTNSALRVIYAGVYLGGELSYFLPANTNTAVGIGGGGGMYVDGVTPYYRGERFAPQSFDGDSVEAHVFINQTIPNPTPLPLNLRATYGVSGSFYRGNGSTQNFDLPPDFLTQTLLTEFRFGGIEPGLTAIRGAELYLSADANYRSGFVGFGPTGSTYPAHSRYGRLFGSLAVKLPAGPVIVSGRICGGTGEDLDQLSAWKLGGNLVSIDSWSMPVHGYYTREFMASDFGLANVELTLPVSKKRGVALHFYGDWATLKPVPPAPREWSNIFGVGVGVGFRTFWDVNVLVSYGYGINAVRNDDRGGHEIGLALEKRF